MGLRGLSLLYRSMTEQAIKQSHKNTLPEKTPSNNIYRSIQELPFDKFLDFHVNGNYRALQIDPSIGISYDNYEADDILELVKAGEQIALQYADASGGTDNKQYIQLVGEIQSLDSQIQRIYALAESYHIHPDPAVLEQLRELGINSNTYDIMLNEVKAYELKKELKEAALAKLSTGEKPTMELYEGILAEIDKTLTANQITTIRFCVLYTKLKLKHKQQEKNGRRKG